LFVFKNKKQKEKLLLLLVIPRSVRMTVDGSMPDIKEKKQFDLNKSIKMRVAIMQNKKQGRLFNIVWHIPMKLVAVKRIHCGLRQRLTNPAVG
jgi:hypothetical protein